MAKFRVVYYDKYGREVERSPLLDAATVEAASDDFSVLTWDSTPGEPHIHQPKGYIHGIKIERVGED